MLLAEFLVSCMKTAYPVGVKNRNKKHLESMSSLEYDGHRIGMLLGSCLFG